MLNKLLCLVGWHDWVILAHDNHMRLTRSCAHCRKQQELQRSVLVLESWK